MVTEDKEQFEAAVQKAREFLRKTKDRLDTVIESPDSEVADEIDQQERDLAHLIFDQKVITLTTVSLPASVDFIVPSTATRFWTNRAPLLAAEVNLLLDDLMEGFLKSRKHRELRREGSNPVVLNLLESEPPEQGVAGRRGAVVLVSFRLTGESEAEPDPAPPLPANVQGLNETDTLPVVPSAENDDGGTTQLLDVIEPDVEVAKQTMTPSVVGPIIQLWVTVEGTPDMVMVGQIEAAYSITIGRAVTADLILPKHLTHVSRIAAVVCEVTSDSVELLIRNSNYVEVVRAATSEPETLESQSQVSLYRGDVLRFPNRTTVAEVRVI